MPYHQQNQNQNQNQNQQSHHLQQQQNHLLQQQNAHLQHPQQHHLPLLQQVPQLPFAQAQVQLPTTIPIQDQPQQPFPPVNERKSRRTHKNSRDGCPNCKAKRIKCTEELPSCANCVKKKYRCSYLDFPKEKLDRIREKNAAKALEENRKRDEGFETGSERRPLEIDPNGDVSLKIKVEDTNSIRSSSLSDNNQQQSSTPSSNTSNVSPLFAKEKPHPKQNHSSRSVPLSRHLQKPIIDNFQTDQPFSNISSLRTYVYKNSMLKLANDIGGSFSDSIYDEFGTDLAFKPWDFPSSLNSDNLIDDFTISHDSQDDSSFVTTINPINYDLNHDQKQDQSHTYNDYSKDTTAESNTSVPKSQSLFSPPNEIAPPANQTKSLNKIAIYNNSKYKNANGNPLPNAMTFHKSFPKLKVKESLKNVFLKKYLTQYQSDIKRLRNDEFAFEYQPVWDKNISANFWVTVYNQSVVLDVYFSFFMDRALNFILNVGNKIVNVDRSVNSSPSNYLLANSISPSSTTSSINSNSNSPDLNTLNNSSSTSSNRSGNIEYVHSSFDDHTLTMLTKKLYNHYGKLILDLRKSLTSYHIEYPTKISIFSTWSSFLHLHATVDSLSLMFNGTAILLSKIVDEATVISDISPTILVTFEMFTSHTYGAEINDYPFDVIHEIYHSFQLFRVLFEGLRINLNERTEDGTKRRKPNFDGHRFPFKNSQEQEIQVFLNNKNFQHDVNELEKFFDKLIHEYYPNFLRINSYFKKKFNEEDIRPGAISYVSFSLLFEMLVHWFKIFPSDVLSMGSKANPFKKTFYLFYLALGRALVHVLPPIRSIMVLDTCHVFCPLFNFESEVYKFETFENLHNYNDHFSNLDYGNDDFYQFNTLSQISTNLIRMVKFFDYRTLFYSYYLAGSSVLQHEYLKSINVENDLGTGCYNDVLKVLPDALDIEEEFITSFQLGPIKYSNFPQLKQFKQDGELNALISQEMLQNESASFDNKFDYNSGLFNYDFNPNQLLDRFFIMQKNVWNQNKPTLEILRTRCHNFELGRREVKHAIEFQALFKLEPE